MARLRKLEGEDDVLKTGDPVTIEDPKLRRYLDIMHPNSLNLVSYHRHCQIDAETIIRDKL